MTAEVRSGGTDLPAPYRSPWRLLARDLRAVAASLVLKLREMWRRNASADLPRPRFWPAAAAPLFWPLVLVMALALPWLGWRLLAPSPLPPEAAAGQAVETGAGDGPGPALEQETTPEREPAPAAGAPPPRQEPAGIPAEAPVEIQADVQAEAPLEAPQAPPVDPLLERLEGNRQEALIASTASDPARGRLRLILTPAFSALERETRQRRAEGWRRLAEEIGYERLELIDEAGVLLGRTALVGSGMILLDPIPLS